MGTELYLVCHKCKAYCFTGKESSIWDESILPLGKFIFDHAYQCDGDINVDPEQVIHDIPNEYKYYNNIKGNG
jgi:hypothetical protein